MEYGVLFLLVIVALFYFQTLLSNMKNKFMGMLLPVLTFISSVVLLFVWMDTVSIPKMIFTLVFLNIPTYILIFIYRAKRKKLKK